MLLGLMPSSALRAAHSGPEAESRARWAGMPREFCSLGLPSSRDATLQGKASPRSPRPRNEAGVG